ncbi:MAG: MFS transporter, partial [Dehalococcoidia bacterium]
GTVGILIMLVGMFLLSTMTAETSNATAIRNIVITGFGLGITMPLFLIAVQNAVPHSVLGIATSTNTFFRTVGGTLGLAIVGSIMNNTFLARFSEALSPELSSIIPKEQLAALTDNPQALVNPDALVQLQSIFEGLGDQGEVLFASLVLTLRQALSDAIGEVFLVSFFVVLVAVVLIIFLKQIPLRTHNSDTEKGNILS